VNDKATFKHIADLLERRNKAILIVGNQLEMGDQREVSYSEGAELGFKHGIPFLEIDTKKQHNIEDIFIVLKEQLITIINLPDDRFIYYNITVIN
jgi:hypothetical protein